ncbi:phosphatidate phosphatase LPIN3-like isoform X2 [Xenia sp. Carnegie-2017]|uniref:phosphatidate phosphatase LPIN3-like isoform X2 n=1 Tax=Xenia sp. Carnegie-2017 TaxID=2897299 RepID=UPI001F0491E1|nr:phosphatidate phosphatase LPIN3-like isoform X2 [Xenia sp. Carnegie-2017]
MNYFGRLVNGIRGYYSEINSATLTGAIDVIVVRQSDGSFVGSPFHVRFGKLGVLRSREKVVDISINDEPVMDLHMKLGDGGEAFFVKTCEAEDVPQYLCTSPIPDTDSLISDGLAKMKKQIKENEEQENFKDTILSQDKDNEEPQIDCDHDNDNVDIVNNINKNHSESTFMNRSKVIAIPNKKLKPHFHQALDDFYPLSDHDTPINTPKNQSPSKNEGVLYTPRYSSDTEVDYNAEHQETNFKATWNWGRLPEGLNDLPWERKSIPELKKEVKKVQGKLPHKKYQDQHHGIYLQDLLSADEEITSRYLQRNTRHREKKSSHTHRRKTNKNRSLPTSKSDTHLAQMDKVHNMTMFKNINSTIDNIKSDSELCTRLEKSSELESPIKSNTMEDVKSDMDGCKSDADSGVGSSTSPCDEKSEDSEYTNIAFSLCGELKRGKVSLERFMASFVSFEDFSKEPTQILSNPKLVIRINDRYYNASVAVPLLISSIVYQRRLPKICIDSLEKEHMPKKTKRRGYSSWFSWRSPPEHNDSTDEESERNVYSRDNKIAETENISHTEAVELSSHDQLESGGETDLNLETTATETYKKVLELSSEQLASLNLKDGANEVTFSVTTKYQGTAKCTASIFLYDYKDKIIISDIDGTITKSDVLGHILPASYWAQSGVAKLFSFIQKNGYKFMYLSARPIGQAELTRQHLKNVVQENLSLPNGPLFLSPSSLIKAFHREVIEKRPQDFKIPCLRNIRKLFPSTREPFFAGFGNRMNDVLSYRAVGIPLQRIFTVNHKGEVKNEFTNAFQSSYTELQHLVDQIFPHYLEATSLVASDQFSSFTYWRTPLSNVEDFESYEQSSSVVEGETSNQ